ncbi:hypothetical protein KHQ89_05985 [Mycoplasmatota bacterium]|nr:hypothetical protein KHQ89_05985 [Mycoplasmatota bacterium]
MLKKILSIAWIFLLFILISCDDTKDNDEMTYQYSYELTKYNYDEYLTFSFHDLGTTSEEHSITAKFKPINEGDYFNDVDVSLLLEVRNELPSFSKNYFVTKDITLTGLNETTVDVTYSSFNTLYDVTIKDISGTIKTNVSHELNIENSEKIEQQLFDQINKVTIDRNAYKLKTRVAFKSGNIESVANSESLYQETPYYFAEKFDDGSGFYISEEDDSYQMYEFGTYDYQSFYRLIGNFENTDDIDDIPFPIEENINYYYTYENDIYYVTSSYQELFSSVYDDQSIIDEIQDNLLDDEITLSIEINDQTIIEKIYMETTTGYIDITMTFTFDDITPYSMTSKQLMPPNNPAYISEFTDITEKQTNQLYVNATPNYYLTELEGGIYALDLDSSYDMTLYDLDGNVVELQETDNTFLNEEHDNIYDIDEGIYIVIIYGDISSIHFYDFQLINLTQTYDTIIDIDNPHELNENQINVEIEGAYDYVLYAYDAPTGGLLTFSTSSTNSIEILSRSETKIFSAYDVSQKDGVTNIFLTPGMNYILLSSEVAETITFQIEHHGSSVIDGMTLTEQYQDDYMVTYDYFTIYLSYEMVEQGNLVLNLISDDMLSNNRTSYSAQIWSLNTFDQWDLINSFNIENLEASIYLLEGNYKIRILGKASLKVKGYFEDVDEKIYEEIFPITIDDIEAYKKNILLDDYQRFVQYPYQEKYISFTLTENEFIYIDSPYNPYRLLDAFEQPYDLYPFGSNVIHLEAGTYYLYFGKKLSFGLSSIVLNVGIVSDPLVINDDYPTYLNQYEIINEEPVSIKKDYFNDIDILKYNASDDMTLTIELSAKLYTIIYDTEGNAIHSTFDKIYDVNLKAGTYLIYICYDGDLKVGTSYTLNLTSVET